jgi:hypothetical protein
MQKFFVALKKAATVDVWVFLGGVRGCLRVFGGVWGRRRVFGCARECSEVFGECLGVFGGLSADVWGCLGDVYGCLVVSRGVRVVWVCLGVFGGVRSAGLLGLTSSTY